LTLNVSKYELIARERFEITDSFLHALPVGKFSWFVASFFSGPSAQEVSFGFTLLSTALSLISPINFQLIVNKIIRPTLYLRYTTSYSFL